MLHGIFQINRFDATEDILAASITPCVRFREIEVSNGTIGEMKLSNGMISVKMTCMEEHARLRTTYLLSINASLKN